MYRESGTFFENYAPELADGKAPRGNLAGKNFVGWTGLAPITVLFEYVFGIKPHPEQNRIVWHVELLDRHGVKKYPFGNDGELTLLCEARASADEMPRITLEGNIPVELEVIWGKKGETQSMLLSR